MSLINTLLLSCRKATYLMERRTMEALGTLDRMQLWMHVRVCAVCQVYAKQNAQIEELLEMRERTDATVDTTLLEQRIISAIVGKGSA